ncbi:protein kinase [Streptomyces sp. NPDC047130]|uniref:protein kinase n=1 Tax=Streptomyces sp. NPDC047130 TaxID=3155261 RepID=UPI00340F568C
MDDYAGRILADRYRLPLPPSGEDRYDLAEGLAFDTYSGQEVRVRQIPLPEVVEAEVLDADGLPEGFSAAARYGGSRDEEPAEPAVRRALEAAREAARIPDHPRLDQVYDVFADGGSLWVVGEAVPGRPLGDLLTERPLTPYRAAEVAADVLMALRVLHAHGWVHRNITPRTVLVCDDGRVVLGGLAAGAAEEALCGYDPVPPETPPLDAPEPPAPEPGTSGGPDSPAPDAPAVTAPRTVPGLPAPSPSSDSWTPAPEASPWPGADGPASRGEDAPYRAVAAYQEGARAAAARVDEARGAGRSLEEHAPGGRPALPGARTPVEGVPAPEKPADPPGRIADPYGVQGRPSWHGVEPRPGTSVTWPTPPGSEPAADPVPRPANPPVPQQGGPSQHAPVPPAVPTVPAAPQVAPPVAPPGRGPATALAAERARQARMTVVGAVTERWAPEQAHPVHDNWQLAAPVGPATDLWALGALLFRAVQGHAPYPEDSTAELVQLVCAEPPAFAEECGPLRPVVESLLRQDPTDRPDVEELAGWLRSMVRSAPEPEAGANVIALPPADPERLPMVRGKGELVRRRRGSRKDGAVRARHRRAAAEHPERAARAERPVRADRHAPPERPARAERAERAVPREREQSPRNLGRTLLVAILLLLVAAVAYAVLFMPKAGEQAGEQGRSGNSFPAGTPRSTPPPDDAEPSPSASAKDPARPSDPPKGDLAEGFTLREDPEGFEIAVAGGWDRAPRNGQGQVVYSRGDFRLIVVPGRDSAEQYGRDPQVYQQEHEPELQPYRDSTWAGSGGLRRIEVGGKVMAEGEFTWTDDQGRKIYVRNLAILDGGRYHVVQLRGPEAEKDQVTRLFEQASATYEYTR